MPQSSFPESACRRWTLMDPKTKERLVLGSSGECALHFTAGVFDDFIMPLLAFLLVCGRNIETVAFIGNCQSFSWPESSG